MHFFQNNHYFLFKILQNCMESCIYTFKKWLFLINSEFLCFDILLIDLLTQLSYYPLTYIYIRISMCLWFRMEMSYQERAKYMVDKSERDKVSLKRQKAAKYRVFTMMWIILLTTFIYSYISITMDVCMCVYIFLYLFIHFRYYYFQ